MHRAPVLRVLLILIAVLSATHLSAQQGMKADSLWCDHLNEVLKCASLDIITDRVGTNKDTSEIAPFIPHIRLSPSDSETIAKEYNKVTYTCYLYSSPLLSYSFSQFNTWHKKVKDCLSLWDETRLKNGDPTLSAYLDYFITNSEDETTVRLDIFKENNTYHVRMRIF